MWFLCKCGAVIHSENYEEFFNKLREHFFDEHKFDIFKANYSAREIVKKVINFLDEL